MRNAFSCAMFALCLVGGWIVPASAQQADLVISHVKVFSPPRVTLNDATVVVTDGRIVSVSARSFSGDAKSLVDGLGRTLIPGIIDTHVHLFVGAASEAAYWKVIGETAVAKFYDFLSHGVTTLLSTGDYYPQILKVRADVNSGKILGPHMLVAGPMITPTNGHPTDIMECVDNPFCRSHWAMQIDDVATARLKIKELAAQKVDIIKIAYDDRAHGNPKSGGQGQEMGHFSPEVVKALISEAHAQGLRVAVYPTPIENAISAIKWGADVLAHGPQVVHMRPDGGLITWPDQRLETFTKLAAAKKIPMSTTIATVTPYVDLWGTTRLLHTGEVMSDWPKPLRDMVVQLYDESLKDVRLMDEKGAIVAFGTDSYRLRPNQSIHYEIQALHDAGLSPQKILQMATLNAAILINREKDIGSIEPGKIADLVLLGGDPEQNIDALSRVDAVFKDGQKVFDYYKN